MAKALHGKARIDRNTRGQSDTSAKTDVFVHEFLRDPVGMINRLDEIRADARYKKKDGQQLAMSTLKSWYGNWSAPVDDVRQAIDKDDWSLLKSYYPAAVDGREELLLEALAKLEAGKGATRIGTELDNERLRFFTNCIESLKNRLPRNYEVPSLKANYHWQWIYKPIDKKVYFEWKFSKLDFTVNLNFETDDRKENQKLLDLFRPMKSHLETKLGTKVLYDDEWLRGGTMWARLYVVKPDRKMAPELEEWAVERALTLIHECEPVLKDITRYRRRRVSPDKNFAGELSADESYTEGAVYRVMVNRYERDSAARLACLNRFGYSCDVCKMNFVERYGEIGEEFIHVHHRNPLALRKAEYCPNPETDLVPVCPNCHAMLHSSDPPLDPEELRGIMEEQGGM